jgi:P pilus assembly chaperone PapD
MISRWSAVAVALAALTASGVAAAGIVMNATRYVYDAGVNEITVKVSNTGSLPVLTQAWIDEGDAHSTPERVDVPFNLTPPIARVESGKSQTLRISYTGATLPADRESLFWINVLEVPPKSAEDKDSSKMQLAFRYRLKLFYRPKGLAGSASGSPDRIVWTRASGGGLSADNPTAYHVTMNDVHLESAGRSVSIEPFAIAPFAKATPKLAETVSLEGGATVRYQSINDYGGFVSHEKTVGAP